MFVFDAPDMVTGLANGGYRTIYYSPEQIARLERVDPLFRLSNARHPSRDKECTAGATAVSLDGEGNLRRCHFVGVVIGITY
jgi:hypothetical protein